MNGDPLHLQRLVYSLMDDLDLDYASDRIVERLNTALVENNLIVIQDDSDEPGQPPYPWKSIPNPVRQRGRG